MKTTKLVLGIISMVLFVVIAFQSCAVGVGNALQENQETSGGAGIFLAICMLIAGIVGVATRKNIAGGYVAGGFYAIAGLIGIANVGSFSDLMVWSVMCLIFAAVFIIGTVFTQKAAKKQQADVQKID